jgi:hypothetical protein
MSNLTTSKKSAQRKRKTKQKKWYSTSQCLVLNAASTNSNTPTEDIPASYLYIINSDTAGNADRELQNQMSELGYPDACFAHSLTTSLYLGDIMWNNHTTPSNLSPFTVFKLDPLSTKQMVYCLHLHLLSKNTKGKLLNEIKPSQIQEVKVPMTFKELLQTPYFTLALLLFYLVHKACSWLE